MSTPRSNAFWRAFAITGIVLSPLVVWANISDGNAAPAKNPLPRCTVSAYDYPYQTNRNLTYLAGISCPHASSITWTMTILRNGTPWAERGPAPITITPRVWGRCDHKGPYANFRARVSYIARWSGHQVGRAGTVTGKGFAWRCR
jgi:hypothetical protein